MIIPIFEITSEDHPNLAVWDNSLGTKLTHVYECTGQIEDLDVAIQVIRQAVKATPEDHPDLAARLNSLGNRLSHRYECTGKIEDLEEAIRMARQAWECRNAVPFVRIRASFLALRLLEDRGDFEEAYELSKETIHLLPYVHNRSLDHQDQQYVVSHFSGLAAAACSLALQSEKTAEEALEILEQGRGVILGLLIDDRSDTSKLNAAYPQLSAHYENLRIELNKPVEDVVNSYLREIAAKRRTDVITELEKCIQHIQQLPGFEEFQKGLTAKQMQNCSTNGSIIVVNITDLRSDAIIITPNEFKAIPLSRLCARQAQDWIHQDLSSTSLSDRGRKNKAYLQFLSWLWRECVKPVLDEFHCYVQPLETDMPRVWWVGTGHATSFPFHSAGDNSAGPTESAYYRVVSSYSPTIKALQHARRRVNTANSAGDNLSKLLVISMPETPGAEPLQGASAERSEIMAAVGPSTAVEMLEYPDVASVMARLQQCDIAHFACHGVSDPVDPSKSGLILQTATEEPRQDILNVRIACQAHLAHAKIAYLSACSTAQNRAVRLSDEVLHVVSGFQVAGFRHVVGCLWPSDDHVCVEMAKSFYSELSQDGSIRYDDRTVAYALHKAVVKIRESDQYRKRPLLWAQFVHFGA